MYKVLPLGDTRKRRQIFLDPVYLERKLSRVGGSPPRLAYKSCSNFSTSASSLRCSRPTHTSERLERLRRRQSASGKFMFSAAKARESWGQLTEPDMRSKGLLGHSPTQATLGEPTFLTLFRHKTWRTVYITNKLLAWLGGRPFCHGRVRVRVRIGELGQGDTICACASAVCKKSEHLGVRLAMRWTGSALFHKNAR